MILFVNGPFGVGKTSVARVLVRKMPHTILFDPIIAGLREVDPDLSCFQLTASRDILIDRIASDTKDTEAYGWRMAHVGACLKSSLDPAFGTEICTDGRTPEEVAGQILKSLALPTG